MLRAQNWHIGEIASSVSFCGMDFVEVRAETRYMWHVRVRGWVRQVSGSGHSTVQSHGSSPVSIQTQSLALRALRKWKPQETQALRWQAANHAWLSLLWPSIGHSSGIVATMIGCLPTQTIAFGWKSGFTHDSGAGACNVGQTIIQAQGTYVNKSPS